MNRRFSGFASFSEKPSEDKTRFLSTGARLHFVKHPRYGSWSLKVDSGQIPERLRGSFTTFSEALKIAEAIYGIRNITIHVERQDRYSSIVNDVREEMGLERK